MIELREITPENYSQALDLDVHPEQGALVASVTRTLADAFVWQGSIFRLAYDGDVMVGFLLVFPYERQKENVVNIVRLMIDAKHQGRGLGRGLLTTAVTWVSGFHPRPSLIRISTVADNHVALSLYRSLGFQDAGLENGEIALYRKVWLNVQVPR